MTKLSFSSWSAKGQSQPTKAKNTRGRSHAASAGVQITKVKSSAVSSKKFFSAGGPSSPPAASGNTQPFSAQATSVRSFTASSQQTHRDVTIEQAWAGLRTLAGKRAGTLDRLAQHSELDHDRLVNELAVAVHYLSDHVNSKGAADALKAVQDRLEKMLDDAKETLDSKRRSQKIKNFSLCQGANQNYKRLCNAVYKLLEEEDPSGLIHDTAHEHGNAAAHAAIEGRIGGDMDGHVRTNGAVNSRAAQAQLKLVELNILAAKRSGDSVSAIHYLSYAIRQHLRTDQLLNDTGMRGSSASTGDAVPALKSTTLESRAVPRSGLVDGGDMPGPRKGIFSNVGGLDGSSARADEPEEAVIHSGSKPKTEKPVVEDSTRRPASPRGVHVMRTGEVMQPPLLPTIAVEQEIKPPLEQPALSNGTSRPEPLGARYGTGQPFHVSRDATHAGAQSTVESPTGHAAFSNGLDIDEPGVDLIGPAKQLTNSIEKLFEVEKNPSRAKNGSDVTEPKQVTRSNPVAAMDTSLHDVEPMMATRLNHAETPVAVKLQPAPGGVVQALKNFPAEIMDVTGATINRVAKEGHATSRPEPLGARYGTGQPFHVSRDATHAGAQSTVESPTGHAAFSNGLDIDEPGVDLIGRAKQLTNSIEKLFEVEKNPSRAKNGSDVTEPKQVTRSNPVAAMDTSLHDVEPMMATRLNHAETPVAVKLQPAPGGVVQALKNFPAEIMDVTGATINRVAKEGHATSRPEPLGARYGTGQPFHVSRDATHAGAQSTVESPTGHAAFSNGLDIDEPGVNLIGRAKQLTNSIEKLFEVEKNLSRAKNGSDVTEPKQVTRSNPVAAMDTSLHDVEPMMATRLNHAETPVAVKLQPAPGGVVQALKNLPAEIMDVTGATINRVAKEGHATSRPETLGARYGTGQPFHVSRDATHAGAQSTVESPTGHAAFSNGLDIDEPGVDLIGRAQQLTNSIEKLFEVEKNLSRAKNGSDVTEPKQVTRSNPVAATDTSLHDVEPMMATRLNHAETPVAVKLQSAAKGVANAFTRFTSELTRIEPSTDDGGHE